MANYVQQYLSRKLRFFGPWGFFKEGNQGGKGAGAARLE